MGRGNSCVHGPAEALVFVDNDYLDWYYNAEKECSTLLGQIDADDFCNWKYDEEVTQDEFAGVLEEFCEAMHRRCKSFTAVSRDTIVDDFMYEPGRRNAIMENRLFYIVVEDNEWSVAFKILQKEGAYDQNLEPLQKRHIDTYRKAMEAALFEQFEKLYGYGGPWTSAEIKRPEAST